AWFAILFTGAYPAGLFRYAVGVLALGQRINAYSNLLTDDYPGFRIAVSSGS
ncbi:MAG: DUF4389 domain-containing protein, partial [Chloroflexi bacterium]|nr:DUF4389 domain-containing protein [Chloroflexota bacterium]